jgi:RNA polymerase primary sigma factor/RNA polymerase sigma factor
MGFRIAQVAELARQMAFTPTVKRSRQLAAAEELLLQIDPAKAYPFDFVVFRITEYHPKPSKQEMAEDEFTGQLLTGLALQNDLGLLIEIVSESLNGRAEEFGEQVLTADQAAVKYAVSKKTLQRARRRGLPARKLIFPNNKRRFAFLAVNVDRFFCAQRNHLSGKEDYSPIAAEQQSRIVQSFRRLAARGCSGDEIAARIGRRIGRSAVAVSQVVAQSDSQLLRNAAPPLDNAERRQVFQMFRAGGSLKAIALQLQRPRSTIFHVLLERRLARLNQWNAKHFDDPLYHQSDAASVIHQIVSAEELAAPAKPEDARVPAGLDSSLQELCRTPLLTPGRERALFLKLNFHKFRFQTLRKKLNKSHLRWHDLAKLIRHRRLAIQTRNAIVAANLRLVVSVARRHLSKSAGSLMELISDGGVTLMRAVNSFDFHRGNRFSTYATFALMKQFARGIPQQWEKSRRDGNATVLPFLADLRAATPSQQIAERDHVRQLLSRLDEREQIIVREHYGLDGNRVPATYEQVAKRLGLSAPCVRKIEQTAMAKLRDATEI